MIQAIKMLLVSLW